MSRGMKNVPWCVYMHINIWIFQEQEQKNIKTELQAFEKKIYLKIIIYILYHITYHQSK